MDVYPPVIPAIIKGGYLIRSSKLTSDSLDLFGDLDGITDFEIFITGSVKKVKWNGKPLQVGHTAYGTLTARHVPAFPSVELPILADLDWKSASCLPEIAGNYDDSDWITANNTYTPNKEKPKTKEILYSSDYGFHTGHIIWRGHFTASGNEKNFTVTIQGGLAFGYSIWDGPYYIGSWEGDARTERHTGTFKLADNWLRDSEHVITILQDHMGLEESWTAATEDFKAPRGIMAYNFEKGDTKVQHWKVTGNLGGEKYEDKVRGPLNEGGLYCERQGFHLPGYDDSKWASGSPALASLSEHVTIYRTTFDLNIPGGVDYPLSIEYTNSTGIYYRSQVYINGYQFGKYVNSIGPQTSFFIPQGILDYKGTNTIAIVIWQMQEMDYAKPIYLKTPDLRLRATIEGGVGEVKNAPMPKWEKRPHAY